jgi:hypothetical protein
MLCKEKPMKRLSIFALLIATAGVAYAQDKPAKPAAGAKVGAATTTAAPRVRNYDFDADFIDGELVRPEGEFLKGRGKTEHGSLIKIRPDFIREIVKSAEDL